MDSKPVNRGNAGKGRPKGSKNRNLSEVSEILARLNCNPFEGMAFIAEGDVPCGVCKGKGRTKFQPHQGSDDPGERICQSCWGSKKEKISPQLRGEMYKALAKYVKPELKAIEVTGADGGAIEMSIAETLRSRYKQRSLADAVSPSAHAND